MNMLGIIGAAVAHIPQAPGAWWLLALFAMFDELLAALILTLLLLLWRMRLLNHLAAEIAARRSTRIAALRRFARQGASFQAVYIVVLLGVILAPDLFVDLGPLGARLCCWGATALLAYALYDALTAKLLYGAIQRRLRGAQAPIEPLLRYKWKTMLLRYAPIFVLVEALGAVYLAGFPVYRWALVALVALAVGTRGICSPLLQRWLLDAQPLNESPWADLQPRIAAWAGRANTRLTGGAYVTAIGLQGVANVGVSGVWRPSLFIGAAFLAHTEWRQRDAVICHELGHVRLRHQPLNILMNALMAALFAALLCAIDLRELFTLLTKVVAPALSPQTILPGVIIALTWLCVFRFDRWRRQQNEFACDAFSAQLTGDPLAMAIGLHTVVSLNGQQMMRPAGLSDTHPRPLDRVNALVAELAAGASHAHWAFTPVPAETQFRLAGRSLTAPLAATTSPAPVPASPYPASPHPALIYTPGANVSRETIVTGPLFPPLPLDIALDHSLRITADDEG